MAQCRMTLPNGRTCNEQTYQCCNCGTFGCKNSDCRNQGFDGMTCLRCGQTGATGFSYNGGKR